MKGKRNFQLYMLMSNVRSVDIYYRYGYFNSSPQISYYYLLQLSLSLSSAMNHHASLQTKGLFIRFVVW